MQHADALPELEVGMGFGRVHVEYVIEPVVVELAYGSICTRVGTMNCLKCMTLDTVSAMAGEEKRDVLCACA